MFERPLSSASPTRRELLLSAALIALLAVAIYSPHVVRGGWYSDDWSFIARGQNLGLIELLQLDPSPLFRPLQTLTLALLHLVASGDPAESLTIGVFLTALQGWLFYLVLRSLRLSSAIAGLAAALFVVLPCIDAIRLWTIMIPAQVAGTLYLLGVLVASHGLGRATGRRAIAWHAGAAVLYAASMFTYELVAGLVLATPLLYVLRAGWRPAIPRLAIDYATIAVVLGTTASQAAEERAASPSLASVWERAGQLLTSAGEVFRSLPAWADVLGSTAGLVLLLVGAVGAAVAVRSGGESGRILAIWATIAAVAVGFALSGLLMFLVADPYYVPRLTGVGNRTGAFAAFGAVVALIALIALALGGLGSLARRPRAGFALAFVLVLATGVQLAVREVRQQDSWADSWAEQKRILAAFEPIVREGLPRGTTLVTFGHATSLPEGVPVFHASWDLRGALSVTYGLSDFAARPWTAGMSCGPDGVVAPDSSGKRTELYPYRSLLFVDVASAAIQPVRDQQSCTSRASALVSRPAGADAGALHRARRRDDSSARRSFDVVDTRLKARNPRL